MVDEIRQWPTSIPCFRRGSCHLTIVDEPIDNLHAFAAWLGLRRSWFQPHPTAPHYDLTISKRVLAVRLGASQVSGMQQARARIARRRNGE